MKLANKSYISEKFVRHKYRTHNFINIHIRRLLMLLVTLICLCSLLVFLPWVVDIQESV